MSNEVAKIDEAQNEIFGRLQKFEKGVMRQPDKRWIKTQKADGKDIPYLPISHIENLLRKYYFGLYQMEICGYSMIVNEVVVHARIKVFHPVIRQWMNYDGIGSVPVQQDQGTAVREFMNTKKTKAIQKNLPAAYALALKNAAKKIGKVFGGDLGRTMEDDYTPFNLTPLNNDSVTIKTTEE